MLLFFLQDFLQNRPACPRAENYDLRELKEELEARGLSTEGSRMELNQRHLQSDISKWICTWMYFNPL